MLLVLPRLHTVIALNVAAYRRLTLWEISINGANGAPVRLVRDGANSLLERMGRQAYDSRLATRLGVRRAQPHADPLFCYRPGVAGPPPFAYQG